MTYTAEIEWVCEHAGILRLWRAPARPGDRIYDEFGPTEVVILKGARDSPDVAAWRVINDALWDAGLRHRIHERHKGDGTRLVMKDILPPRREAIST